MPTPFTLRKAFMPLLSLLPCASLASAQNLARVAEQDLALLLPADSARAQTIFADEPASPVAPIFEKSWYEAVLASFRGTSVGEAPSLEGELRDWRLVSVRVAPCNPLGGSLAFDPEIFCWPEIRLVWQPIVVGAQVIPRTTPYFADDRAIHALYDVSPGILPRAEDAQRAKTLLAKVRVALAENRTPLQGVEFAEFESLRNQVAATFLREAMALRSGVHHDEEYGGFRIRPEFDTAAGAVSFRGRLRSFLARHAPTPRIKELTAFSLPEGRQPPLLDEWVFVAFEGENGRLRSKDITLRSPVDGRRLFNFGKASIGSQRRDDPRLHTALDSGNLSSVDKEEITSNVMLFSDSPRRLQAVVSDRRRVLVPNTSCASCHKMNDLAFDFHNLSYLEDSSITVSPRVVKDVELDLAWARSRLVP